MKLSQSVRRYALAAIDIAKESDILSALYESMSRVIFLASQNSDLKTFLMNPVVGIKKKIELLEIVFSGSPPLCLNIVRLLEKNHRLAHLVDLAHRIVSDIDIENGKKEAILTTAFPVTDDLKALVLEGLVKTEKKTWRLKTRTDPKILGGFILQVDSKRYDSSFRESLDRLRTQLL